MGSGIMVVYYMHANTAVHLAFWLNVQLAIFLFLLKKNLTHAARLVKLLLTFLLPRSCFLLSCISDSN